MIRFLKNMRRTITGRHTPYGLTATVLAVALLFAVAGCSDDADTDRPQNHSVGRPSRDRPPSLGHLCACHAKRWVVVCEALPLVQYRQSVAASITVGTTD